MCTGGLALLVKFMHEDMDLACAQAAHKFVVDCWAKKLMPDTAVCTLACMGGAHVCSRFLLPLFQTREEHLAAMGKLELALKLYCPSGMPSVSMIYSFSATMFALQDCLPCLAPAVMCSMMVQLPCNDLILCLQCSQEQLKASFRHSKNCHQPIAKTTDGHSVQSCCLQALAVGQHKAWFWTCC